MFVFEAQPAAALQDHASGDCGIQDRTFPGDATGVKDVEFSFGEGRCDLVLHHVDAGAVAISLAGVVLQGLNAGNLHADGGVELKGVAARSGFRRTEHDANLHTDLVREDAERVGIGQETGELTHGLGHQARLSTHVRVTNFAIQFALRHQGCDRVHDHHVHGARAHQLFGNLEGLFTRVGLGQEQVIHVHADALGIVDIQGVFSVNKGHNAAFLLGIGRNVQGECGLTRGFVTEDFHDATLGHATCAEGEVERECTSGDHGDLFYFGIAHLHDCRVTKFLTNLAQDSRELVPRLGRGGGFLFSHCGGTFQGQLVC